MATGVTANQKKLLDYIRYPETFIKEQLDIEIWSGMQLIIDTVWHNEYTTVRACHGISKTFVAAAIAVTFLNLFPQSIVITTAPTGRQVEKLLWKEIGAIYKKCGGHLYGHSLQLNVKIAPDWFMMGFSTDNQTSAEGVHASRVLWILDEAKGLPPWVCKAVDASFTGGFTRALEISTTDGADQQCEFRRHHEKDRGKWGSIHLSAMDSPFIDPDEYPEYRNRINTKLYEYGKPEHGTEWPAEKAKRIQITSAKWMVDRIDDWQDTEPHTIETKVWGEFSLESVHDLIALKWIESAIEAQVDPYRKAEYGLDVARFGDDLTVLTKRSGGMVYWQHTWAKEDTMQTTGMVMHEVMGTEIVKVDIIGVGAGVFDRLAELGQPVIGLTVSERPTVENQGKYTNLKTEIWFNLRDMFQQQYEYGNTISIPDDPALIEELTGTKYKTNSKGLYQMESKDDFKKRMGRSPDKADSLGYAMFTPIDLAVEAMEEAALAKG